MGHARVDNISRCFNKMIRSGSVTIRACVDQLEKTKQTVHASEGAYEERYMLSLACEQVVDWLLKQQLIVPVSLTKKQNKLYQQFMDGDCFDWDSGDDGEGGEYGIFDSIPWRMIPGRKILPVLYDVTN